VSGGDVIDARDIDLGSAAASQRAPARTRAAHAREEADRIAATLRATGWNVCEVSRTLGIPRATLYRKMKRYGLAARG
jgi:transcriptional regulator of acetoin/glycerol metabolism